MPIVKMLQVEKLRFALAELIRDEISKPAIWPKDNCSADTHMFVDAIRPLMEAFEATRASQEGAGEKDSEKDKGGENVAQATALHEAEEEEKEEVPPIEYKKIMHAVCPLAVVDRTCDETFLGTALAMLAALRELREARDNAERPNLNPNPNPNPRPSKRQRRVRSTNTWTATTW